MDLGKVSAGLSSPPAPASRQQLLPRARRRAPGPQFIGAEGPSGKNRAAQVEEVGDGITAMVLCIKEEHVSDTALRVRVA